MNKILIEIVVQFALYLELTNEAEISLETVVRQQEDMAFRLQKLSTEERIEFIRILREIAKEEPFLEHREILSRLPFDVGIEADSED